MVGIFENSRKSGEVDQKKKGGLAPRGKQEPDWAGPSGYGKELEFYS